MKKRWLILGEILWLCVGLTIGWFAGHRELQHHAHRHAWTNYDPPAVGGNHYWQFRHCEVCGQAELLQVPETKP